MRFNLRVRLFRKDSTPNKNHVLTLRMKAVLGAHVVSSVVIATASSFADVFGNTNPSAVGTFFDVDGTTFVSC